MRLTITAAIHARWGHRVDGLIHTHAWTVEATLVGPADCDKVFPADDLEALLADVRAGVATEVIAARFHQTLATAVARVSGDLCQQQGVDTVVLKPLDIPDADRVVQVQAVRGNGTRASLVPVSLLRPLVEDDAFGEVAAFNRWADILVAETDQEALDIVQPILDVGYRGVTIERLLVGKPVGQRNVVSFRHQLCVSPGAPSRPISAS